jgi:hypothetical protein
MMRWIAVLLIACGATLLPRTAAALSISFTPPGQFVGVGGSVTLVLEASALAGAAVGGFDVDVSFDAALFTLTDVTFSGSLGDVGLGEQSTDVVNGIGSVSLGSVSLLDPLALDALQGDPVALVSLTFQAVAIGAGAFVVEAVQLSDAFGAELVIGSVTPATVDVVPEPALAWLLALGAGALAMRRRSG